MLANVNTSTLSSLRYCKQDLMNVCSWMISGKFSKTLVRYESMKTVFYKAVFEHRLTFASFDTTGLDANSTSLAFKIVSSSNMVACD